ncbi:MAG: serine hydrolase domain-containing protein, partial [Oceanococcaceae bacterium]
LPVQYEFDGEQRSLEGFLQKVVGTGLLVIQGDRIVHEQYLNGGSDSSLFTSWSVAKSFVSTLVGMALGDGLIASLDDPISLYVPELLGSGYEGVPIRHVLQMSSGVGFDETYNDRFSDIQQFFVKVFILGQRADDVVPRYGSEAPAGSVFHYISLDTQALGMLLRRVYQRPLVELLSERIWQPLGMEADAFWNVDRDAEGAMEVAFCCLNARLRDYAKLGRLYLNDGVWEGQRLLPEGWVQAATTPGGPHLEPGASPYDYGPRGYGYQWWVPEGYEREYFAAGVWGQYIYVSEPDKLIIVRSSVDQAYRPNMAESIAVFRAIRDALR